MVRAIRQFVTIQPGGRVDLVSGELPVGSRAEVIVLVISVPAPAAGGYLASFGSGRGTFADPAEVNTFLRAERDRWGA